MTDNNRHSASAAFLQVFRGNADADGAMTFERFMELALYDPIVGYYCRDRGRVGYAAGTDFFTASTSGPIFGELVAAACVTLLGSDRNPQDYSFVEIGAETAESVLGGVDHSFRAVRTIQRGESPSLEGKCVVFSNELFDAQPFRRFVGRGGHWCELGVALREGALVEIEIPLDRPLPNFLPAITPEGYQVDAPLAAAALATKIAAQSWTGLFVACDYGKALSELMESTPTGTARAYFKHTQSNQLLARPGEQDLTCHVCWDWLIDVLGHAGFIRSKVESQEAFFIRHAANFIAALSAANAAHFSQRKLSLMQLLHPAHLGQKFQVLHAWRD